MTDRDDGAEDFGMLAALHERSLRFSEAIDRLDAEVASHESGKVELVIENLTGEEVEYAVLGPPLGDFPDPDFTAEGETHGGAVGEQILPADSTDGPRFGSRVREWDVVGAVVVSIGTGNLRSLADAIDRDAERQAMEAAEAHIADSRYLRQRIKEAVERLKQCEIEGEPVEDEWVRVPLLLAELGRIFGERREQVGVKAHPDAKCFEIQGNDGAAGLLVAVNPDGDTLLWPRDPAVGQGFALHAKAARDLVLILSTQLPEGDFSVPVAPLSPESIELMEALKASLADWKP